MSDSRADVCPLCDRDDELEFRLQVEGRSLREYHCRRCGNFRVTEIAIEQLRSDYWRNRRWLFSGVTRRASDNTSPVELSSKNLEELVRYAQPPATPFDAIDRVMSLLAERVTDIDGWTYLDTERDHPLVFVRDRDQLLRIYAQIVRLGYARNSTSPDQRTGLELTLDGWRKIGELRLVAANSDQAFVAMSFDDDMRSRYTEAIAPALDAVGYAAFRVDNRPHNEKIDDRIVAEIRQSGLLVADFTRQKNGVYWEAGFAQGLGIPVVRSCHSDDLKANKLHFDTRQYLHIEWANHEELREKLQLHIRATIPGRAMAKPRIQS